MTLVTNKIIENVNKICSHVIMPLMLVMLFAYNTVLNDWILGRAETIQNLLAVIVLAVIGVNLLYLPQKNIPKWIKDNVIIIAYFLIRVVTLLKTGVDYSAVRSIFFEAFFLFGITSFTLGKNKQDLYVKIFITLEIIFSLASLALYYTMPLFNTEEILMQCTNLETQGKAMLFGNTNTAGIMAAFSVLLAIVYYRKKSFNKKVLVLIGIYNLIAMLLFGCRSADLGLFAAIVALILVSFAKVISKKKIIILSLICSILVLIPLYAFTNSMIDVERFGYQAAEQKIDDITTGRYIIWKESIMIQEDDILFGKGSLKLEQKSRQDLVEPLDQEYYWRYVRATNLGPHNGYIGMISSTGILGLLLFTCVLVKNIVASKFIDKDDWYILLVFIFVVNCFESLFILNRFFLCFFMFLILRINEEKEKTFL